MNKLIFPVILALVASTALITPAIALAKKSPDYKAGFAAGKSQEDADEAATNGKISTPYNGPCSGTADYCAGFKAGYEAQAAHSFG
jgi:hypothetical protein